MGAPALMRRRRPGHVWAAVEGSLLALVTLVLMTVAWINDPLSPGRLGLLLGAWGVASWMVWRAVQARGR